MVKEKAPRTQNEEGPKVQVTYLPLCVIAHILSMLPAEMILICRSVCKSWYALTHDSSFLSKHFQWSKNQEASRHMLQVPNGPGSQNLSLLDIHERRIMNIPFNQMKLPMPTYPNQYDLTSYSIVCECNGLLCLVPKVNMVNVVICNPITRECLLLPSMTKKPSKRHVSYQLGFHFDEESGKYKVIREFRFMNRQPSKFQLINVGESSWKDLDPPLYILEQALDAAICWDGAFHWKRYEHFVDGDSIILSFDFKEEEFFKVSYPKVNGRYYNLRNYRLANLGGCLKIIENESSRCVKIWKVIGRRSEGYSIVLQHTCTFGIPPSLMQRRVISQVDDETYLIQVTSWEMEIEKCYLQIFSRGNILDSFHIDDLPPVFRIIAFKPSLVSPFA